MAIDLAVLAEALRSGIDLDDLLLLRLAPEWRLSPYVEGPQTRADESTTSAPGRGQR
jgi:hypothetical protein